MLYRLEAGIRERKLEGRAKLDFRSRHALLIDTSHLEQALRVIPMGRKNWLFCWSELGSKHVGIMQSLLSTCQLHQADPYTLLNCTKYCANDGQYLHAGLTRTPQKKYLVTQCFETFQAGKFSVQKLGQFGMQIYTNLYG